MWLDATIITGFILYSVFVGFAFRKLASRGLEDYFLAGRSLRGWQAGLSMAATQYAADTPLLVAGLVAASGIFSLWRLWVYAIAFLLMGFVLGGCWRRSKVLTDAEFTEIRYAGPGATLLRALKALHLGTLINCTILAMVLLAATRIAEQFLFWHQWLPSGLVDGLSDTLSQWDFRLTSLPKGDPHEWLRSADNMISVGIIVAFTWLYSTTGGLRSVVATDVLQFSITMIATAVYACVVVFKVGGLHEMGVQLQEAYGSERAQAMLAFGPHEWNAATYLFLAVLAVQWFAQVNADGTGYLAQRIMSCSSDKEAKKAAIIFTFAQVLLRSLLWLPIVVGLLVLYPAVDIPAFGESSELFLVTREGTFAQGIRDFLPVGLRGLMLTGLLAALASTIDTHLNWGASYWTNDLYKRCVMEKLFRRSPKQHELVWVARLSNLGVLVLAIWIMRYLDSVQTAWHLSLLFGSGLGSVLVLRWLWYRINLWSEISAGVVSLVGAPTLLLAFPEMKEEFRLLLMVLISTGTVFIVTFLTPPEPRGTLMSFYTRVRPSGFWKPIAEEVDVGEEPPELHLARRLAALIIAALSLFCLLVGFGQLFVNHVLDQSSWTPYQLIIVGILFIPVWTRFGFTKY